MSNVVGAAEEYVEDPFTLEALLVALRSPGSIVAPVGPVTLKVAMMGTVSVSDMPGFRLRVGGGTKVAVIAMPSDDPPEVTEEVTGVATVPVPSMSPLEIVAERIGVVTVPIPTPMPTPVPVP